jgi:hypothetical protein
MAIVKKFKDLEIEVLASLNIKYEGLQLCELGNQDQDGKPAKFVYEATGVNHTSIDLNGRDGALPLDLGNPLPVDMNNKYDVITNYGTIEHVNNQYGCYLNVHNICKVGGIMIHGAPFINNWPNHCRYYYEAIFFEKLAELCGYDIIRIEVLKTEFFTPPRALVYSVFMKTTDSVFIPIEVFDTIPIVDSKDMRFVQNYDRR